MGFHIRTLVGLGLSGLLLGCAHATYHAPEPTVASNGVALSVVSGQRCFVTRDDEKLPPPNNDNRVHVGVTVRIDNASPAAVGVAAGQVRLTPQGAGAQAAEMAPIGGADLSVPAGESLLVPLEFTGQGRMDCHQPFDLDPRDALTVGEQPVVLAPVPLVSKR